jgi:CRISPR-associated protein Cmr6
LDKYIGSLERYNASAQASETEQSPQCQLVKEIASLPLSDLYKAFYQRWSAELSASGARVATFQAKSPLVVGLGNESVLETSIALHRTYGVPYLPGSALKGLAAAYACLMGGPEWQPGEEAYQIVFGDTTSAGYITFLDALYKPDQEQAEEYPLRIDVITVHHGAYYKGPEAQKQIAPPADWDSPNPVSFLSARGRYLVALNADQELDNRERWLDAVLSLLTEALLVLGIGAKTSSGYGRMKRDIDTSDPAERSAEDQAELAGITAHLEKIQQMLPLQVGSQMKNIGLKWVLLKSPIAIDKLGKAIIAKVRETGKEDEFRNQLWYKMILDKIE